MSTLKDRTLCAIGIHDYEQYLEPEVMPMYQYIGGIRIEGSGFTKLATRQKCKLCGKVKQTLS